MATLKLEVQSAKLTSSFGHRWGGDQHGKWIFAAGVKLTWPERLELGTGEKPSELRLALTFRETDAELLAWASDQTKDIEGAFEKDNKTLCGTVTYHEAWVDRDGLDGSSASIIFYLFTPPDVMASLIRFAEGGRFLKSVTLEVRGLEYGYEPDGRTKKWLNNADVRMLPVVTVDYELPLSEEPADEPAPGGPNTNVGADLVPVLTETMKWVKAGVWILAMAAVVLVAKHWH